MRTVRRNSGDRKVPRISSDIIKYLFRDELGHAEPICEIYRNKLHCTDSGNGSRYMWDEVEMSWKQYQESQISYLIATTLKRVTIKYTIWTKNKKFEDLDEATHRIKESEREQTLKELAVILKKVRTHKHVLAVCNFCACSSTTPNSSCSLT